MALENLDVSLNFFIVGRLYHASGHALIVITLPLNSSLIWLVAGFSSKTNEFDYNALPVRHYGFT